jgi:hypothetical protein
MIVRSIVPSQGYDVLNVVILDHLVKVLGLGGSRNDVSAISAFFVSENSLEPIVRWLRGSFLEWYAEKVDLPLNVLLAKIARDHPVIPFDSGLLGAFPKNVQIPPLTVPLVPVSRRDSELTLTSWIPGLEALLDRREFELLNHFWGVRRISVVWSEPEPLRETIKQFVNGIDLRPTDRRIEGEIKNGAIPWIDLDGVTPAEKINHWFSPVLQRRYQACPVYCGKRLLTLAVAKPLDALTKAEIEGVLRHRFSVQQVIADPMPLQRFITASESKAINTAGIVRAMIGFDGPTRDADPLEIIQADKLQESAVRSVVDEQAVIKFVHSILYKGVDLGASDIMFQEFPQRLRVRYKVDGDWFDENGEFPGRIAKQVISRIKVIRLL